MINNYQDAMAICRCYGNPDLFITFTCNVKWPEIHREIKKTRNYQPEDKLDIIVRVFHSKLIDMMSFIKSGKPFGRTITGISILFLKFQVFFFSFCRQPFLLLCLHFLFLDVCVVEFQKEACHTLIY